MLFVRKNNCFYLLIIAFLWFSSTVMALDTLRADNFISVVSGKIVETGILSDTNGMIFLEFSDRTRVVRTEDRASFQGEILAPSIIALPDNKPRARTREILTFEFLGDTADELLFTDQFYIMRNLSRLRYQLQNLEIAQSPLVRVIIPIQEPVGRLGLWKYKGEDGWERVGGKTEETEDLEVQLFSSTIPSTGIFSLLDENPAPDFVPSFPIDQIELVEQNPFAETTAPSELLPNEAGAFSGEDASFEESAPVTINDIPPVEVEGATVPPTEITIPVVPAEETITPSPEELTVPEDGILPQSGPEGDIPKAHFPFMLLFAFLVLGSSIGLAFWGKKSH